MRMTRDDLEIFVRRHAELDPGFPRFLRWARECGVDVKIVSDGFDATIETLLGNHGIEGIEIFANQLILGHDRTVQMASPYADPECGKCGTCKLKILRNFRDRYDTIILAGDGESDRHAAGDADLVLARKDLFVYCARQGIPALRLDGFDEVPELLTRQIRAVAFDMDGTLVESLGTITDSFNHMFRELGYPEMTVEEVARKTSISLLDFVRSFLKPEEQQTGVEIFRNYYDTIFRERTTLMPGAMECLKALEGNFFAGVVTNKRGPYARKLAEHLGFAHHMSRIIGAEDGFKAKPSPDMFEEFMRSTGTDKKQTIYVGDSPLDVQAARNAGIDTFAVAGPIFSAEELALYEPRRVLQDLSELIDALDPVV